ncbi:glycosyltransferase [Candidatus Bipolaricaulota bacterium]
MKKRVLFFDFVTTFGGAQRVTVNVLSELRKRSSVRFLDPYEEPKMARELDRAGVPRVSLPIWPRVTTLGWQKWHRRMIVLLFLSPSYGWYVLRLAGVLRREQPFSAIYTNSKKGVIISALASLLARVPLIYHAHGFGSSKDIGWFYRQAIKRASVVIAVSEDVTKKLVEAGIPSVKTVTIYNGVPVKVIRRKAEQVDEEIGEGILNTHSGKILRILLAANLQPAKGVHVAVEAARKLLVQGVSVELWILGNAAPGAEVYVDRLRQMVKSWHLDRHIRFLGWGENIAWIMSKADVIIVPSLADRESFGMVLAEAMALGKPTIGSRVGGGCPR